MIDDFDILQATMADALRAWLSPMPRDERRYALAVAEMKTTQITPDAGVDRAKRAALRAIAEAKKSLSPDLDAPIKCTAQQINELVNKIREGKPPELPKGKREKHYHDPALPGFYIRVRDTGAASWVVQSKQFGRQKKFTIGDVLVFDRQQAIKAAKDLLAKIQLKILDPHEARRERMRANKVTFETQIPLFIEHKKRQGELKPRTAKKWTPYFIGYFFKPLHKLPIDEITKDQIQTQIDIIANQSGNDTGYTCCTVMRVFFKWAIKTGKLPEGHHNPMTNVQTPARNAARERVLTDDEIRLIWKACDIWEAEAVREQQLMQIKGKRPYRSTPKDPDAPRTIKLLLLTGCRRQEVGGLRWSEVDLDNAELFIPGSRRKSRKKGERAQDLCVPLADLAVQILRDLPRRPNNDQVFGRSIEGINLMNVDKRVNREITKAGGIPPIDWVPHDIRRTFRTKLAALGVTMDVGERLVGHVGHRTEMDRVYNLHEYWAEKRQAIAKWESHLRAIIDGTAEKIPTPRFGERKQGGTA
jgi:integrase